jgi:hypothetical protein
MKYILNLALLLVAFSCTSSDTKLDFAGVWIDKNYLLHKGNTGTADSLAPFPLIVIDKEGTDSLLMYYSSTKKNRYWAEFVYQSYFVHIDKDKEYLLVPDFDKGELVYSDMQDKVYGRFQRLKTPLTQEEILSADFNLDTFIQTAK